MYIIDMKYLAILISIIFMTSCHARREVQPVPDDGGVHIPRPEIVRFPDNERNALPKATIYRTSGNYNNHVFITLGTDGTVISYPAPSDVTEESAPLELKGGWLLDRRGISKNAAFLRWTYAEYHALPSTPSIDQLKAAILPDARVTAIERLPMTANEAAADTAAVNQWIATHLMFTIQK